MQNRHNQEHGRALRDARRLTLGTMIHARAQDRGQHPAIIDGAMCVSFAKLDHRTDRVARALAAAGIGHGDRVASLLLDGLPAIELLLGAGKLGAITVALNWRLAAPELQHVIESAEPRLLVHSECFAQLVSCAKLKTPCIVVPDVTSPIGAYEDWVASAAATPPTCEVHSDDGLYMLYTSGTTGRPKGCLQSHLGTVTAALGFAARRGITSADRLLSTAPLFHVAGLSHLFCALAVGAASVLVPRGANPEAILRLISESGCTFGSPPDALLGELFELQQRLRLPLRLRTLTRGASLTPPSQVRAIRQHLGADAVGGYGQSEIGGFATMIDGGDMIAQPSALGYALPHLETAVLGDDGVPDLMASMGELGLRGPAVMLGYWNDAQATRDAIGSGWLRTGDVVRRDTAGMLHFAGRIKELIKTGGENVYPREVENVLLQHPAVADAAIIGVPDLRWGEAVKACIVLRAGATLTASDAVVWCKQHIAGYKRPRFLEYVESIPRDHLGKIQRPQLRQRPITPDQAVD